MFTSMKFDGLDAQLAAEVGLYEALKLDDSLYADVGREVPGEDSAQQRRAMPGEPAITGEDGIIGMEGEVAECHDGEARDSGSTGIGHVQPDSFAGSAEGEYVRPARAAGSKEGADHAEYLRPAGSLEFRSLTDKGLSVLPLSSAQAVYRTMWLSGDSKIT